MIINKKTGAALLVLIASVLIFSTSLLAQSSKKNAVKTDGIAIDMGLSVKWASCDLGENGFVRSPKEDAALFAWGEAEAKSDFKGEWRNYKWATYKGNWVMTKYSDRQHRLEKEDDAAANKLGGGWRMPTHLEFKELIDNCDITEKKLKGVRGLLFTSKINGNSIFFPGEYYKDDVYTKRYWCDDLDRSYQQDAYSFYFKISPKSSSRLYYDIMSVERYKGFAIRPVLGDDDFFEDFCQNMTDNVLSGFRLTPDGVYP